MKLKKRMRLLFLQYYVDLRLLLKIFKKDGRNEKKNGTIVVVTSADENYAMPLATMIASMVKNLKSYKNIKIYILENSVSLSSKEKIKKFFESQRVDIEWIKIDACKFRDMKISGHITVESYFRLLMPELLPEEIEKVIYLDSDLIVDEDIGRLWDMELGETYLLAAPEMHRESLYASSPSGIKNYKQLGIDPASRLFNSGVLVINIKKWREVHAAHRIIDYLNKYNQDILWADQEAMNAIFAGIWGPLDPSWNLLTQLLYEYNSWKESPLDKNAYKKAVRRPFIIHFNTGSKPWQKESVHPYKGLFFYYLDMTPWKGWRPKKAQG